MMTQSLSRPVVRGVIYGAIGGFVGGLVMYAVMSGVMLAIGMGANCFAVVLALITGQPFSNSLVPIGIAIHLITSTAIAAATKPERPKEFATATEPNTVATVNPVSEKGSFINACNLCVAAATANPIAGQGLP